MNPISIWRNLYGRVPAGRARRLMERVARLPFPGRTKFLTKLQPSNQTISSRNSLGLMMELDLADPAERRMFYGEYDSNERDLLRVLASPGDVVLDIGAHIGYFTLSLAQVIGKEGRLIAFEPSPSNFQRLQRHIDLNQFSQVEGIEAAVSNSNGEQDFFLAAEHAVGAGPSFLGTLSPKVLSGPERRCTVKTIRVDDLLAERAISHVDLIKMDVEGGEMAALEGMDCLISGTAPPRITCEISAARLSAIGESPRVIHDHLNERGYVAFRLEGNLLHRVEGPLTPDSSFENHLFLPMHDPLLQDGHAVLGLDDIGRKLAELN